MSGEIRQVHTSELDYLDSSLSSSDFGSNRKRRGSPNDTRTSELEFLFDQETSDDQGDDDDLGCYPIIYSSEEEESTTVPSKRPKNIIEEIDDSKNATTKECKIQCFSTMTAEFAKFTFECCRDECLRGVDYSDLVLARNNYNKYSKDGKKQWLLNYLWDHSKKDPSTNLCNVIYCVRGHSVCQNAWLACYGINIEPYKKIVKLFHEGIAKIEPKRKRKISFKRKIAFAWMENHYNKIGDKVPDGVGINLPSYLTYKELYKRMKEDLSKQVGGNDPLLSYSLFCDMMKEDFADVRIPKVNRFTKCDVCTVLKEEKEKTQDEILCNYFDTLLNVHNEVQKNERQTYYKHRQKAKDPDQRQRYLCIIIDGMDQEKLLLPSLIRTAKSYANAWKLRTHLTGVLNHGQETLSFLDIFQWPHDSNYTINILLRTIVRLEKIPDILYLQMDNCFRENKNQFMLNFLGLLVLKGIFKKVKVNFLMVGHTHEDVDQMFSKIGGHLKSHNIRTLDEMIDGIGKSYRPSPSVLFLESAYDVKTWMADITEQLHSIINPHCFVIQKDKDSNVVLRYKNWSTDPKWLPSEKPEECVLLFKAEQRLPKDPPSYLQPSSEKIDLPRVKIDIQKFLKNSAVFEESHINWWQEFLDEKSVELFGQQEQSSSTWLLDDIFEAKGRQQTPEAPEIREATDHDPNSLGSVPMPENVPERVVALVEKNSNNIPEVYTGRYRNPQEREGQVTEVSNHLESLQVGVLVAIAQANSKPPVIGKVHEVGDDNFKMSYWKGSWRKKWEPWKIGASEWISDDLPKSSIILIDFHLDADGKLQSGTSRYLRNEYKKLESNN